MKKHFFVLATIIVALLSCSSNGPKEISPTSTEFISGELAKLVQVVNEPCQISYAEQEGVISTQYIRLKVKLKLVKESPELQKVDAQDIEFSGLLSVATVNLVDENETKVQDLNVKSEDLLKLKKLLQGKEGDEETIAFEGEFHNSDDAPKWFEQTTAFTPYLTGDVVTASSSSFDIEGSHDLYGTVDKYPITMHIEINGSMVKGSYYYDKQGANARLKLSGSNDDGVIDINETDADGTPTGHFKGEFSNGIFKGLFITNKGKKMPFAVAENSADISDIDYGSIESDDSDDSDYSTTSSGAEDWDALLSAYENYVDKYISYMNKAAKGDMTALAEYPSLMEKAQEFCEKLQNAQGEMSGSQLARYNKITMKMANAANKMR